jgi:3-phenylpropionate/trans-cinnamate dioxygenase ferredoxin reductase subunit
MVFRGDPAPREFLAFMIADDLVVAAMSANVWDVTDALQSIIRARQPIDVTRLVDVDVPLDAFQPAP